MTMNLLLLSPCALQYIIYSFLSIQDFSIMALSLLEIVCCATECKNIEKKCTECKKKTLSYCCSLPAPFYRNVFLLNHKLPPLQNFYPSHKA